MSDHVWQQKMMCIKLSFKCYNYYNQCTIEYSETVYQEELKLIRYFVTMYNIQDICYIDLTTFERVVGF